MWYTDPRVLKLPRINPKLQLCIYLVGFPLAAWEIGIHQRKQYSLVTRDNAERGYPFYGQRWGAQTDYAIELSLETGDLLFWNFDVASLHPWEAVAKKASGQVWDNVGIIEQTTEGAVVHFGPVTKSYREVLADFRTSNVGVRRLQVNQATRSEITATLNKPRAASNWGVRRLIKSESSRLILRLHDAVTEAVEVAKYNSAVDFLDGLKSRKRREEALDAFGDQLRQLRRSTSKVSAPPVSGKGSDFVYTSMVDAGILPYVEDWELITADLLAHLDTIILGTLGSFFFPRNGSSGYSYEKTTAYLGSLSYSRLSQGKSGSPVI